MNTLLDFFFACRTVFYKFERNIIEEVKAHLESEAGIRLQKQVDGINKIQRLAGGKEVNLYHIQRGKPTFDNSLRFPSACDEALLANMNLIHPEKHNTKLKVEVWLVKGQLFSLLFNKPPKQFFIGLDLKLLEPEMADVKIWFDPMLPQIPSISRLANDAMSTEWLQEWVKISRVTELCKALSSTERESVLRKINAQLPFDYLTLMAQTEGMKLSTCTIYGVSKIRKVVCPDENYYLLAEIEGLGALVVKEGSEDAKLYLFNYENNDISLVEGTFKNAVAILMAQTYPIAPSI
ncbi:hypothetical protein [Methylovulum psychrotolerans]|uniref:Uncharacterized protein n=1 Tax=Methylovulum psychrotolerans TaxID=1704499 RepID=A0A2S5CPX2_9GAMM|nr:hypothetical protein [Methylovulum psychrotolerans]POZ52861.1 hypothetical protein AADEFJLK_01470 [Methylovulum psychrotolerans]